jgi:hypothetical protein
MFWPRLTPGFQRRPLALRTEEFDLFRAHIPATFCHLSFPFPGPRRILNMRIDH